MGTSPRRVPHRAPGLSAIYSTPTGDGRGSKPALEKRSAAAARCVEARRTKQAGREANSGSRPRTGRLVPTAYASQSLPEGRSVARFGRIASSSLGSNDVGLVPAKPTASGRVTRRASSDPAWILRQIYPGLDTMREKQEWPPPSSRESPLTSNRDGLGLVHNHAPNGGYSRKWPPRGTVLIPRPLAVVGDSDHPRLWVIHWECRYSEPITASVWKDSRHSPVGVRARVSPQDRPARVDQRCRGAGYRIPDQAGPQ